MHTQPWSMPLSHAYVAKLGLDPNVQLKLPTESAQYFGNVQRSMLSLIQVPFTLVECCHELSTVCLRS